MRRGRIKEELKKRNEKLDKQFFFVFIVNTTNKMSIRRQIDARNAKNGKNANGLYSFESLLEYPSTSALVHVERNLSTLSLKTEDTGAPNEDDNDVQARREGKKMRMEAEEDMRKRGVAILEEKRRLLNKYIQQGKASITLEELQRYNSYGDVSLDLKVSEYLLREYSRQSLVIMARLPPSNEGSLVPLRYWQMSKIGITILETAAQMCDAIVAEFQRQGLHPIRDAVDYTGSMRRDITFDFSYVLPAAMAVPRDTISSATVQIFARTTPSKANSQLNSRFPISAAFKPTSAITWSVLFNPGNRGDERIRQVVNLGLNGPGGRADSKSNDEQITIKTQNGLNAALNELWERLLQYTYEPYAHAWNFAVPSMIPVTFGPSPVRNVAPAPAPAPPALPAPPPGMLPGGWMRAQRRRQR